MPKRAMKKKAPRSPKRRAAAAQNSGGDSFLGLLVGAVVIAAGFAYAFGYFPESFQTASFNLQLPALPDFQLPEVPHSN